MSNEKAENLLKMQEYQESSMVHYATMNNVEKYVFVARFCYKPKNKKDKHVLIFRDDVKFNHGIFIEFSDKLNVPEDAMRQLYFWPFNPEKLASYDYIEKNDNNGYYLFPLSELSKVPKFVVNKANKREEGVQITNLDVNSNFEKTSNEPKFVDPSSEAERLSKGYENYGEYNTKKESDSKAMFEDSPIMDMTIRDVVALFTGKEVSKKEWLNKIIREL